MSFLYKKVGENPRQPVQILIPLLLLIGSQTSNFRIIFPHPCPTELTLRPCAYSLINIANKQARCRSSTHIGRLILQKYSALANFMGSMYLKKILFYLLVSGAGIPIQEFAGSSFRFQTKLCPGCGCQAPLPDKVCRGYNVGVVEPAVP